MTEKEILEQLYRAEQSAKKAKEKRGMKIYIFFAIITFILLIKEGNCGVITALLLSVFGGVFFAYIFLLFYALIFSNVNITFPEDEPVNYWKKKLHEVRGEDYYRDFFNKL